MNTLTQKLALILAYTRLQINLKQIFLVMRTPIITTIFLLASITCHAQTQLTETDSVAVTDTMLVSIEEAKPEVEPVENGMITTTHENGKKSAVGEYKEGIKIGEWKYYDEAETLIEKGNYIAGKKSGQWFCYHDNGLLKSIGWYKNGKKTGAWGIFYNDGSTMQGEVWKDGKLISVTEFYALDGDILPRGTLKDGNGNRFVYNKNRKLIEISNYQGGLLHGLYESFYSNGKTKQKGNYDKGQKVGEWEQYDKKGVLLEGVN